MIAENIGVLVEKPSLKKVSKKMFEMHNDFFGFSKVAHEYVEGMEWFDQIQHRMVGLAADLGKTYYATTIVFEKSYELGQELIKYI
jgi:hypothetical protein